MAWFVCTLAVLAGWFVLALITTNLVGFVGRGFLQPMVTPDLQALADEDSSGVLANEARGLRRADRIVTLIFVVLTVGFLWLVAYIWNIWVAVAAIFLMLSRAPDLIWEIRHGQKITSATMPKTPLNYAATGLSWAALPLLWFAVCR